jgi:hypothetical protein
VIRKLGTILHETAVVYCKLLSPHLLGVSDGTHAKATVSVVGLLAKIEIRDLPCTVQDLYSSSHVYKQWVGEDLEERSCRLFEVVNPELEWRD